MNNRPKWVHPLVHGQPQRPIVGFWHIGVIGDWRRIVGEQYATLLATGLHAACEKIVVGLIGGRQHEAELPVPLFADRKLEVFVTEDITDYEFPTLARLWQEAADRRDAFDCFYFHTKGASNATPATEAWRRYMEYFNLERWPDCVAALVDHDTCGVELDDVQSHYGGNFWWATSDYIRKLPNGDHYWRTHRDDRGAAELYVCLAEPKARCFVDFTENLYDYELPPSRYRR